MPEYFPPPPDYITTHDDVLGSSILCTALLTLTIHCGPACVHISKKLFFSDFIATILIFAAKCRLIQLCNLDEQEIKF